MNTDVGAVVTLLVLRVQKLHDWVNATHRPGMICTDGRSQDPKRTPLAIKVGSRAAFGEHVTDPHNTHVRMSLFVGRPPRSRPHCWAE